MADSLLTALFLATPAATDLLYMVVSPDSAPADRKATISSLAGALSHASLLNLTTGDPHTQYRLESDDHTHQSAGAQAGQLDHGLALLGLTDDDHTQYGLLAGRAGGQVFYGGNAANDDLTLEGTSHATKTSSYVLLQPNGGNVGIGTATPDKIIHVRHSGHDGITTDRTTTAVYSGHTWVDNGAANERWFIGEPDNTNNFVFRNRGATNILTMEDAGAVANTLYLKVGTVGIGTASTGSHLHIKKTGGSSVSSGGPSLLYIESTSSYGGLSFGAPAGQDTFLEFMEGTTKKASIGWNSGSVPYNTLIETAGSFMVSNLGASTPYLTILSTSNVGIGISASLLATLHTKQGSTTGAIPVLALEQADVDQHMIEFITTIGTGNAIEAVGAKVLTTTHFIMVQIPGGLTRYFPVGTIA